MIKTRFENTLKCATVLNTWFNSPDQIYVNTYTHTHTFHNKIKRSLKIDPYLPAL